MLITIVAIDEEKGIGKNGQLPWHIREDLQLFKQNTLHHSILMGQTTYDHMPRKLRDRHTYVCSIDPEYQITDDPEAEVIHDLEAFLKQHQDDEEEVFVCGGASIYRQSYPYCKKAYISFVKGTHDVDTYFDAFNLDDWIIEKEVEYEQFIYREMRRRKRRLNKARLGRRGARI